MWVHQWKLEFNSDPTKQATEVLFSCKKSSPNHPHIMFNGTILAKMDDQKHLGLSHINETIIKAKKNLGLIKRLSMFLPHKTLDLMNKAPVRSHFDYCDIISYTIKTDSIWCYPQCPNGKKLKEFNTKQPLLLPVHGKVHVVQSSMRNWSGNHYLVVVGVGAFCKYIRL